MKTEFSSRKTIAVGLALAALLLVAVFGVVEGAQGRAEDVKAKLEGLTGEERVAYLLGLKAEGDWSAATSFYLGNAYLGIDEPDSAIVYFERAVALDSTYAKAYVNLGIAFDRINRFDRARASFERAIEVDPKDVLAHCHLGHYYHVRGDIGKAVTYYQKALEIDPESAQAHYNLGLAFADSRLFAEAVREWEMVVALSPDSDVGRTAAENVKLIKTYMDIGE
jgi:Tfp pilus assembly protein PilF